MKTLYTTGIQMPGRDFLNCYFALAEIPHEDQVKDFLERIKSFVAVWAEFMHPVELKFVHKDEYKEKNGKEGKIYLFLESNQVESYNIKDYPTGEEFEMVFESKGLIKDEEISVGERFGEKVYGSLDEFVMDCIRERGMEFFDEIKKVYPQNFPKSFDESTSISL